jgi:hypothetical protein
MEKYRWTVRARWVDAAQPEILFTIIERYLGGRV